MPKLPICLFSKHLQFLDYDAMADTAAEIGFDGIDLTVRRGGHVKPERARQDLPRAVAAIKKAGLQAPMMATNIHEPDSPHAEAILETAAEQGITFYRMQYYRYDLDKERTTDTLERAKASMEALERLNERYGMKAAYQNHAGRRYLGAPVWDLGQLLHAGGFETIGMQYDIRHATVEGGESWRLGLDYVQPFLFNLVIKDFRWERQEDGSWYVENVPLGTGMVDFPAYLQRIQHYGFQGPISYHIEYKFHERDEPVASMRQKALKTMGAEIRQFRSYLEAMEK